MSTADPLSPLMSSVDPALVVVTTVAESEPAGCLVGFHSQASISPSRYCLWLSKANHTYRVGLRATHFALHFLTAADLPLAEHFGTLSGEDRDKFAGVDIRTGEHGLPLLAACPNRLILERLTLLDDGGDHSCLIARVLAAHHGDPFTPLRLSGAAHLSPGHDSGERVIRP